MFLESLCKVAKLPLYVVIIVLRYFVFGGIGYRKYASSLRDSIMLTIFRTTLSIDIRDAWIMAPYSNSFLIRKMFPLLYRPLVSGVPGYGERYDKNSFWLAKLPGADMNDPVIIYSHGGGYFLQTQKEQLAAVMTVYHLLGPRTREKTSILLLDYQLLEKNVSLPTQLMQLHETYSSLLKSGHKNIILMGDSAGGHLSISYTQYLSRLGESVIYPSKLILISPWVKIAVPRSEFVKGSSWLDNQNYDMIHYSSFAKDDTIKYIYGETDPFSLTHGLMSKEPRQRDDWSRIPNFSSAKYDLFIITGEDESFRDDILQFSNYALDIPWYHDGYRYGYLHQKYDTTHYEFHRRDEEGNANLSMYIEPWGIHDGLMFMESGLATRVCRDLKAGKNPALTDADSKRYFGTSRLVKFLNERL